MTLHEEKPDVAFLSSAEVAHLGPANQFTMTLHEDKPDVTHLRLAEVAHLGHTNCNVSSKERYSSTEEDVRDWCREFGNITTTACPHPYFNSCKILERQDSLARAATLQECDRNRDPDGILHFLETTMNIEDYLEDITFTPKAHIDDVDVDEFGLSKYNVMKDDKKRCNSEHEPSGYNCGTQEHCGLEDPRTTSGRGHSKLEVKIEPGWEDNPSTSSSALKRNVKHSHSEELYTPTTTARKYRLKTPQERNNTSYKVKRQRNNDAVRKSRSKAKQLQLMKDKQLQDALMEVDQLKEKLRIVNEKLSRCVCRH